MMLSRPFVLAHHVKSIARHLLRLQAVSEQNTAEMRPIGIVSYLEIREMSGGKMTSRVSSGSETKRTIPQTARARMIPF